MRNWPLTELSVTTPRLQLRHPSLDDVDELADRAAEGIHDPGYMPFLFPWSDTTPEERARSVVQYQFRAWGSFSVDSWTIELAVVHEGRIVGVQSINAKNFPVTREVETGSWVAQRFQGQGIGTEMRRAVLHLAFAGLGAHYAVTTAFEDNHASLGVTKKLGYKEDGIALHARGDKPVVVRRFRMAREDWTESPGFEIHNLDRCLPLFGLSS